MMQITITSDGIIGAGILKQIPRDFVLPNPPSTVPFQETSDGGLQKGDRYVWTSVLDAHLKSISPADGYKWMKGVGNMVINPPQDVGSTRPERIGCGGNYFRFDRWQDRHFHIVSLPLNIAKIPADLTHEKYPDKVWKACTISNDGSKKVMNIGNGYDGYWIYADELWVHENLVELFPGHALDYRFYGVDIFDGETSLMVTDKSNVRTFPTRWHIDTVGVIPPQGWKT